MKPSILNSDDNWTPYMVDEAVVHFGRFIENMTAKRDKKGNQLHKLEDLLAERGSRGTMASLRAFLSGFGGGVRIE